MAGKIWENRCEGEECRYESAEGEWG